jgi:hypothetical protein
MSRGGLIDMAHACGCQHGSSGDCGDALAPIRSEETVGEIVQRIPGALQIMDTVMAALSEGQKAPA